MPPRALPLILLAALTACEDNRPVKDGPGSTTPRIERTELQSGLATSTTSVRIGELGPNFAACVARGSPRERTVHGPVPVRAGPYEQSQEIDRLPTRSEFFVCSRSLDQRWLGIVYDEGGVAAERCGVSEPIQGRRNYQGPCAAGWVSSAQIRFVSGIPHQLPPQAAPETLEKTEGSSTRRN